MTRRTMRLSGKYVDLGRIRLGTSTILDWCELCTEAPPNVPYGTTIEMAISYEQLDCLTGRDGIVWATHDRYQADTIKNALVAQNIPSQVLEQTLGTWPLYLICVEDPRKTSAAIDFIWRADGGLEMHPDWWYPAGASNESFERWVQDA